MAEPELIVIPKDTWVMVLSNVKVGQVWIVDNLADYYQTYRDNGAPGPTSIAEAVKISMPGTAVQAIIDIDVYVLCKGRAGRVRVDTA